MPPYYDWLIKNDLTQEYLVRSFEVNDYDWAELLIIMFWLYAS